MRAVQAHSYPNPHDVPTKPRGVLVLPDNLPLVLHAETLRKGLNFTLIADIGTLDLLGDVRGVGFCEEVVAGSTKYELFGYWFPVIEIGKLIVAKQTAGRPKDQVVLPELEAVQERLMIEQSVKG